MSAFPLDKAYRRAWAVVCFPFYLVWVFFLAGSVFGWCAACDQLEKVWKA